MPHKIKYILIIFLFLNGFVGLAAAAPGKAPDFTSPRQVTSNPGDDFAPALSPDGRRMVFVSDRSGNLDLWIKSLGPGIRPPDRRLTWHSSEDNAPSVSPDGQQVAFISHRSDPKGDLYILPLLAGKKEEEHEDIRQMTDAATGDGDPAWSPDQQVIYYSSTDLATGKKYIFKIDVKTKTRSRVTESEGIQPAVSPEGRFLVFVSQGSSRGLKIKDLTTGQERGLTDGRTLDLTPRFAGKGSALFFTRYEDDTNHDGRVTIDDHPNIWSLDLKNGSIQLQRQLTDSSHYDLLPAVHGKQLFYTSHRQEETDIWRLPVHGLLDSSGKFEDQLKRVDALCEGRPSYPCLLADNNLIHDFPGAKSEGRVGYRRGKAYLSLHHTGEAARTFRSLVEGSGTKAHFKGLAEIELLVLGIKQSRAQGQTAYQKKNREGLDRLRQLSKTYAGQKGVESRALLEKGHLHFELEELTEALLAYQEVIRQFPKQTGVAAEAAFSQSKVYAQVGDQNKLVKAFVDVVRNYYGVEPWSQKAIQEVLNIFEKHPTLEKKVFSLQNLAREYKTLPRLAAAVQNRIGELYHQANENLLAKEAYGHTLSRFSKVTAERDRAYFQLARIYSEEENFEMSLTQYDQVRSSKDSFGENIQEARRRYIRKTLEKGTWELNVGEVRLALKTFLKLIDFSPSTVEAHRGYIQANAALKKVEPVIQFYRKRLNSKSSSPVDHYALGLALTYRNPPALDAAQEEIGKALVEQADNVFYHQTLGWIFEQKERKEGGRDFLEKALQAYRTALALNDESLDPQNEANLLLNLGNGNYSLNNLYSAYQYYDKRFRSGREFVNADREALFYQRFGETAFKVGYPEQAVRWYQEALDGVSQKKDIPRMAELHDRIALAYQDSGDHARAVEYFSKGLELHRQNQRVVNYSRSLRNIANNLYSLSEQKDRGDPEALNRALGHYFDAIEKLEKHGLEKKKKKKGKGLVQIDIEAGLGDDASSAASGFDQAGEQKLIFHYIGTVYRDFADYERALVYFEKKLALIPEDLEPEGNVPVLLEKALLLNQIGNFHFRLGRWKESRKFFQQSFDISRMIDNRQGLAVNAANIGRLMAWQGRRQPLHQLQKDLEQVVSFLEEAVALLEKGDKPLAHPEYKVFLRNYLGVLYYYLGYQSPSPKSPPTDKKQDLRRIVAKALNTVDKEYRYVQSSIQNFEAGWKLATELKGPRGKGLTVALQQNLKLARYLLSGSAIPKPEPVVEWNREFQLADWQFKYLEAVQADPPQQLETLLAAESMLSRRPFGVSRGVASLAMQESLYRKITRQLFLRKRIREALQFSEKGFQQTLVLTLQETPLDFSDEMHSAFYEELQGFRESWEEILNALDEGELDAESFDEEAAALHEAYLEFMDMVREEDPALAELVHPELPDLDFIQEDLKAGQILVKFENVGNEIFVWAMTPDSLKALRLPVPAALRNALTHGEKSTGDFSPSHLASLSRFLLGPLHSLLENAKTLILLPAGSLEFLPWPAMTIKDRPLVEQVAVAYQSSLGQLHRASAMRNLYNSRFLSFEIQKLVSDQMESRFATVNNFSGKQASIENFFERLDQYGVVHVDGSTMLPSLDRAESYFNLNRLQNNYQRISLRDILELRVEANFIALNEVRYHFSPESEISPTAPLLQGLTFAGYPGVLLHTGTANPEIHQAFLKVFYREFRKNNPLQSLRKAQNELRKLFPKSTAWTHYRFYGYPGMDPEEKAEFASVHFKENLSHGVGAYKESDWATAIGYFEKALALVDFLEDKAQAAPLNKTLAQAAYNQGDFRKAIHYQGQVLDLASKGDDPEQLAEAHYFLGILFSRAEDFPPAVKHLKQALAFYEEYEILDRLAESYSTLGIVEENALDYDRALQAFSASIKINEEIGEDMNRGKELRRIGRIYYLRLNRYADATQTFEQANALFRELDVPEQVVETWLELGLVAEKQGNFERALDFYGKAQALATEQDLKLQLSKSFLYQSNSWWFQGNYQNAFRFQKQALELAEAIEDPRQQAFIYNTLGLIHWTLNDSVRALDHLETSRQLAEEVNSLLDVASAYNNMGLVYRKDKNYEKAIELFQEALQRDIQLKSKWGQGYTHRNLGISYLRLNQLEPAEQHILQAIQLSEEIGNRINLVKARLELGHLSLEKNECKKAIPVFRQTAKLAKQLNISEVTWRALRGEGFCLARSGRLDDAIRVYRESVAVVDQMRAAIKVEEFQNGFLTDKQDVYKELILLLLDSGKVEESFNYAERAKSRSFIDLLGNQKINLKDSVSQKLYDQLNSQKQVIRRIEDSLGQAKDEDEAGNIAKELVKARTQYQDFLIEAKEASPEISNFVTVDAITLERLYQLLEKQMGLVEYLVTPKELIAWVVTPGKIEVVRTPVRQVELEKTIKDYRTRIQKLAPLEEQSIQLYNWLVRPVLKKLGDARVIGIIPQGILHYLSFASLYDGEAYLMERHPLFYSPSASVLEFTFKRKYEKNGPVKVLALGNPDLGTFNYDLPLAELEAKAIRWDYPEVTVLTRGQATESWLTQHIEEYQVIHIASHGEFDPINPLFSSLKLAKDDKEDGNFEVNEVFSLNIQADLVTLSACQTGLGDIVGGDELVGLNRAFIYAGTHAIVSSLWRVSDISTAVLIKHFYRNYVQQNKAESLRQAQLLVKRLYPHPAYWAGFSLTGDFR